MSNLIQYIIQEDPEEEMKKKQSQSLLSRESSSQEDIGKNYKFSSRHLLENDFSHLNSKQAPTARSYLSQALTNSMATGGNKVSSALSPKPIGNDNASYKVAQNAKGNVASNIPMLKKYQKLIDKHYEEAYKSEGNPNYVYLDPKYIKSIGRGKNINSFETFNKINFKSKKSGNTASEQEKIENFNKLENWIKANKKTDKHNYRASYFKNLTDLYIDSEEEKRLHTEHVLNDIPVIKNIIKNYDELSFGKQLAILDMVYNIGATKFTEQFVNFIKAANANSEEGMLAEYHRKDISEARNKLTADLLKK